MVSKEDASSSPLGPCKLPSAGESRKMFWRSASWSSSRTALQNLESDQKGCGIDPNGNGIGDGSNGQNRRYPVPLTPRSQQKRSCLPPLQPLSIARRSLEEWPKAGSDDSGEWPLPPTPSGNKNGDRLKLDLSSIQKNPERNGGSVKRDRIAFFDKECSKVAEHIYLGGDAVARDREILKQHGITHVLNCVGFVCPEYFKADLVYRTLWLQDSPTEDITSILYDVFDYFEDVREQNGRVFVHCCQGVSRSTSLVIAYLMWREGQSFDDAFQYVKAARGIADPNMGFACQLLQCQKRVHAFPLSPSSLLRLFRIAPHSPYDPLHLVPRMLNDPSPSALDSRGAFIVHIPSGIYIWIGKLCEAIMERDARGAVCQIVRYERAQGPIIVIKEGEEPTYFWDAFSNYPPLMDKSGSKVGTEELAVKIRPGERRVDNYNVDFEIFQKAIKGGFAPPFASSENEHETHLPVRESCWSVLRRKFAPDDMKEFISAPKIFFSRVYSESRMVVRSSSPLSSSFSSSSSSPPYLSPDSLSSDSSTSSKYISESSVDSPSASLCSVPLSSTLSNLSNLSLLPSKSHSQPSSNSPSDCSVNNVSQLYSHVDSLPYKKSSPSLAERRGSLSKSLKLPVLIDNVGVTDNLPQISLDCQEDVKRTKSKSSFSWCKSDVEIILESKDDIRTVKDSGQLSKRCTSMDRTVGTGFCHKDGSFVNTWDESLRNNWANGLDCKLDGTEESVVDFRNLPRPLAYRWPSFERLEKFDTHYLDSAAAFAFLTPTKILGRDKDLILYIWLGKSFSSEKNLIKLDSSRDLVHGERIDTSGVACPILTEMTLEKNFPIKIIKEDEEPAEFFTLLKDCSTTAIKDSYLIA